MSFKLSGSTDPVTTELGQMTQGIGYPLRPVEDDTGTGGAGMPVAPEGGQYLADGDDWIDSRVQSASTSWLWSTDTTPAPPALGVLKINSPDFITATELYINTARLNTIDTATIVANYKAGDRITIVAFGQPSNGFVARVNDAPTDNSGWFTIPITIENATGGFLEGQTLTLASYEQGLTPLPVYGTEYHFIQDEAESSTSSLIFVNKLTLITGVIPDGIYRITTTAQLGNERKGQESDMRVVIDGVSKGMTVSTPPENSLYQNQTEYFVEPLASGSHTIEIDYKSSSLIVNRAAIIRNARIELFRVS